MSNQTRGGAPRTTQPSDGSFWWNERPSSWVTKGEIHQEHQGYSEQIRHNRDHRNSVYEGGRCIHLRGKALIEDLAEEVVPELGKMLVMSKLCNWNGGMSLRAMRSLYTFFT